jgi:hypothetical protein
VDPRVGLDVAEKRKFLTLPGLELQPLGRPASNHSLYRLHYPGSLRAVHEKVKLHIDIHRPIIKSESRELVMKCHPVFKGTSLVKDLSMNKSEAIFACLYQLLLQHIPRPTVTY